MENRRNRALAFLLSTALLSGCGPSIGGMGGMPMGGVGMMGMPMGGFAYGGAWGHSTNVYVANHTNIYDNHGGGFYHPGRMR